MSNVAEVRSLIRSLDDRMAVDELVDREVMAIFSATGTDKMPSGATIDAVAVQQRVEAYEKATENLARTAALIGRWGLPEHVPSLASTIARLGDAAADDMNGQTAWIGLRWLPVLQVYYAAGVSAVAGGRYDVLSQLHGAPAGKRSRVDESPFAVARAIARSGEYGLDQALHELPEFKQRRYSGASEYLLGFLRRIHQTCPGTMQVESAFDRFEILETITLLGVAQDPKRAKLPWGRFRLKAVNDRGSDPLTAVEMEATQLGTEWPPAKAGLFGRSSTRFLELTQTFRAQYLTHLYF